jgi:PAS domain S-box-containing protein
LALLVLCGIIKAAVIEKNRSSPDETPSVPQDEPIRLLVVDDDEDAHFLIMRFLGKVRGQKYKTDWARSYTEGLEIMARKEHQVYLVDYRLGSHTGLDLLRKATALGVSGPMIILTGGADPRVDLEATKIGAADFLIKDALDSDTLERSIRYSLQHHATMAALQKSHERFHRLFDRSLDAILMSDHEGRVVEANDAACALFGRPLDHIIQRGLSTLFVSSSALSSKGPMDQARGEISFRPAGGQIRLAEFSACGFTADLNLIILRDITARRELEKEIQEISEREQRRLGEDLHDGLGQELTGIGFLAKALQQKLGAKNLAESKDAAQLSQLINQALSHTRNLARGLCPVVLESNDLQAALQQLAVQIENVFSVHCLVDCPATLPTPDNAVAVQLYRIAQEAATNAVKHAKPGRIRIVLQVKGPELTLRIEDDGIGFPASPAPSAGMGLRVMRHRAKIIGAALEIDQREGGGTRVTCRLAV